MSVDISSLKELRGKTGAGMMDCRRALLEAGGELEAAEAMLKDWGLAGLERRAERPMKEGRIFLGLAPGRAALVELLCETDFASRSEPFRIAGERLAGAVAQVGLEASAAERERLVGELGAAIKENLALRRILVLEPGPGEALGAYLHGDGRIGALVLTASPEPARLEEARSRDLLHDLALHVAAAAPRFVSRDTVPEAYVAERLAEFRAEIADDERLRGKSGAILEAALAGKLRKHLARACLLEQGYVREEQRTVAEWLRAFGAETGLVLEPRRLARLQVGEE